MRVDTQISRECIFREIASRRILDVTLTKKMSFNFQLHSFKLPMKLTNKRKDIRDRSYQSHIR